MLVCVWELMHMGISGDEGILASETFVLKKYPVKNVRKIIAGIFCTVCICIKD